MDNYSCCGNKLDLSRKPSLASLTGMVIPMIPLCYHIMALTTCYCSSLFNCLSLPWNPKCSEGKLIYQHMVGAQKIPVELMNKFSKSLKLPFFFFFSFYPNLNNSCQFYFWNISWILLIFSNTISAVSAQVQLISWLNFSFALWIYTVGSVNRNEKSTANPTFQWFPAVKGQRTKDKARPLQVACQASVVSTSWCDPPISQFLTFA